MESGLKIMPEIRDGDIVTADSVLAEGVVPTGIVSVDKLTRWYIGTYARIGDNSQIGDSSRPSHDTFAEALVEALRRHAGSRHAATNNLVLYTGDSRPGRYIKLDGSGGQLTPVNKWPYVQDYKLATAVFAHRVSSEYRPHEYQISQQMSRGHRPLDPHSDASNQANSVTLNQFRLMAGLSWSRIRTMEIFSGNYLLLLPAAKMMLDALCFECGFSSFMRKAVDKMHHASFETRHDAGDTPSIVRPTDGGFWTPGPNMTSSGGNASADSKWRTHINMFRQARDHYDNENLGNLTYRDKPRRPVYIDDNFWPEDPTQS